MHLPFSPKQSPAKSDPSGDEDRTENNARNSPDPEEDVRRLAPALSTFLTLDDFLRQLVATSMERAKADSPQTHVPLKHHPL